MAKRAPESTIRVSTSTTRLGHCGWAAVVLGRGLGRGRILYLDFGGVINYLYR